MKLSKQQLKTSTRHYIKKCAGAVCTSKLHESARNSDIDALRYALYYKKRAESSLMPQLQESESNKKVI